MEINKAKVFVYMLTFVGYVWSGYGSSVLTNLKDAVLAAEHVFGDVIENVVKAVNGFSEIHKTIDNFADEDCVYKCPDGSSPVRNKYYKPTGNGCGPEGAKVDPQYIPFEGITKCCNEHDICYGTCNKDKEKCDLDFKRCLYSICDNLKSKTSDFIKTGCKLAAKGFFSATQTIGCPSYKSAQETACYCSSSQKKKKNYGEL
ncbi:phospholipase A2 group XII [Lycorma delicatula]|uniref:phospholipase A2 group XII n=1 Tax=Lycorma delicatula TaxID=130591 RepID=UPI003F50FD22